MRFVAAAVSCALFAVPAMSAHAADDPAAEALFARSRAALALRSLPPYAVYDVAVSARLVDDGTPLVEHFHSTLDTRLEKIHARMRSAEEAADPATGNGTNILIGSGVRVGESALASYTQINGTNVGKHYTSMGRSSEYLGVPILSPAYTFGLARTNRMLPASAPAAEPTADLAAIGRVTTVSRTYDVADAGTEEVDGVLTRRLLLTPLHDPQTNRLRELWIDPADALPVKLRVAANFTQGPSLGTPWTIFFRHTDEGLVIDREAADAPLRVGRATLDDVVVRFENVEFPRLHPYETIFFDGKPPKNALTEP